MSDVLAIRDGTLARLTLNRPRALNALTLAMVHSIEDALTTWEDDRSVVTVLLEGTGERAFCAGGDIATLYDRLKAGDWDGPARFFAAEYRLNRRLARYSKPVVAVMHGVTMGGGIGLGGHVRHRIVTPTSRLAMPEVGIGFIPDVGGTHLLGTAPGELGTYAALTGAMLGPADALACGLADLHVEERSVAAMADRLVGCRSAEEVGAALEPFASAPAPGVFAANRPWIDAAFAHDDVGAIVTALVGAEPVEAREAGALISSRCPTSLVATLRALRYARAMRSLERCFDQELRLALHISRRPDFTEGVRAAVIDKDRRPRWHPADLRDVDPAEIDRLFAPLDDQDRLRAGLA